MSKLKEEKGFTLIELLAVITIIGVLIIIAIPSISLIIQNVRKSTYINSAKVYKGEVQKEVVNQSWPIDDPKTSYYIHINNAVGAKTKGSPWAAWKDAYVGISVDETGDKDYYWLSVDKAGWKVDLTESEALKRGDVHQTNDMSVNYRAAIDADDETIVVFDANGVWRKFKPWLELTREEADKCYSYEDTSDETITLTHYKGTCGDDITVPAIIGGKVVNKIHHYAFYDDGLTSVYIPDAVEEIGVYAFAENKLKYLYIQYGTEYKGKVYGTKVVSDSAFANNELEYVVLDEGVQTIGHSAFKNNKLKEAVVPESVTTIGACSYCDNPIPNPTFLYGKSGDSVDYSIMRGYIGDLTEFPDKRFVIPADANGVSLKEIKANAFYRMSLDGWDVVLPPTVKTIGGLAFANAGINSVNLPHGLEYIGLQAFYFNNLVSINIPSTVTYIGDYAFSMNKVPTANNPFIYKRNSDGSIDYSTLIGYAGEQKYNIVIPESKNGVALRTIADGAFQYSFLEGTVKIPNSVTYISNTAFVLNHLTDIVNGDDDNDGMPFVFKRKSGGGYDKTYIIGYGGNAEGGNKIKNVTIPDGVKTIGDSAFYYSFIEGVELPDSLVHIGSNAFKYCRLNGTVTIPKNVTYIGEGAFEKLVSWDNFNAGLVTIENKTGQSFNWRLITGGPTNSSATFETGIVRSWYGDITVTK